MSHGVATVQVCIFTRRCKILNKTDRGRAELQPSQRILSERARAVLVVADGRQTTATLHALFGGLGASIVRNLLIHGHIAEEAPPATAASPQPEPTAPLGSFDTFLGPRSRASARMFLFDLNERLFTPREKGMVQRFHSALREARDAQAMLAVSRDILTAVERLAGADRAGAISERLAKLLPESVTEST
jgi:hypothetical protein